MLEVSLIVCESVLRSNEYCSVHIKNFAVYLLCCFSRDSCCTTGENWHTLRDHSRRLRLRRSFNPWLLQRRAFGAFFATRRGANLIREEKSMVRTAKRGSTDHATAVQRAAWSTKMWDCWFGEEPWRGSISNIKQCVSIQEFALMIS